MGVVCSTIPHCVLKLDFSLEVVSGEHRLPLANCKKERGRIPLPFISLMAESPDNMVVKHFVF